MNTLERPELLLLDHLWLDFDAVASDAEPAVRTQARLALIVRASPSVFVWLTFLTTPGVGTGELET